MKKKSRRCDRKVVTKEAEVLKYLRESRKLSMRDAAIIIGKSSGIINHAENGRVDLSPEFIFKLLSVYGVSFAVFSEMCKGELETPQSLRRECLEIIKRLDEGKLKTVKTILQSF
jgi:transcriptional regulator with XRE-family HTH domain